jgi:CubicO group peptidase (beta-lactamase class C family)
MAATSIGSGAVSGEPLEAHFRKHIFEPLGMNDTGFVISPAQGAQVLPFADQRLLRVNQQFERGIYAAVKAGYVKAD